MSLPLPKWACLGLKPFDPESPVCARLSLSNRSAEQATVDCVSEQKLQAELHNPRCPGTAHFVDAQIIRISATRSAERGGAVVVGSPAATRVDRFPLGVIEGVEGLPPELQSG